MKNEALLRLLADMGSQGRAEGESAEHLKKSFYAVPEQMRALDPDVTLVLGSRGAGKTSLFRAISEFELSQQLRDQFPNARIPANAEWLPIDLVGKGMPPREDLQGFFEDPTLSAEEATRFWEGTLIRKLWNQLRPEDHIACAGLNAASGSSISAILSAATACSIATAEALDRLDDRLESEQGVRFIGYDDLDLLVQRTGKGVSTALSYWATRSRRWKGIRSKLFMRTDLYTRFGAQAGPDLAKISANRVTLSWSDQSLLGMLVKRILNAGDIEIIKTSFGLGDEDLLGNEQEGWRLRNETTEKLDGIITSLLGPYMGANPKKGATRRWIINHIKDCQGSAVPRFLVRLVESAADLQARSGNDYPTPLSPLFIREALAKISSDHVKDSEDEWPWLPGLRSRIERNSKIRSIPVERKLLEQALAKSWSDSWGIGVQPPCEDYRDFLPILTATGIMRERSDGRYETTDLYLDGLGFKRKGGVKKRGKE